MNKTHHYHSSLSVAVLIPCYNEAQTIRRVIEDFRRELPKAVIYVGDNNSTDQTAKIAEESGAIVIRETNQGKGNMIRRMFADIESDVYVMVDGDATYDAASVHSMIEMCVDDKMDMVNGARKSQESEAYRAGHRFGNWMFTTLIQKTFKSHLSDILSGYRVFSRRFVKSFPSSSHGFEIETELTVHAFSSRLPVGEVETPYGARPEGSVSKLSTYKDGMKILAVILLLVKEERPLLFFSVISLLMAVTSVIVAIPVFYEFFVLDRVYRVPTAVLATGLMMTSLLCLMTGLILDTVSRYRSEMRRLSYLGTATSALSRHPLATTEEYHKETRTTLKLPDTAKRADERKMA